MPDRSFLDSAQFFLSEQPSVPMKTVYAANQPFGAQARIAYLFGERFGVGAGVGFQVRMGTGIAPSDETPPEVWIWQVPIEVEGLMRLILWKAQPVVPYLRGGLSGVVWSETWAGTDGDLDEASGIKWGVHVGGGAQFRLPFPEINWRGRVVGDPVLDDIYIYVEGWARSASDFGSAGLDLSAFGAAVGLSLLL